MDAMELRVTLDFPVYQVCLVWRVTLDTQEKRELRENQDMEPKELRETEEMSVWLDNLVVKEIWALLVQREKLDTLETLVGQVWMGRKVTKVPWVLASMVLRVSRGSKEKKVHLGVPALQI